MSPLTIGLMPLTTIGLLQNGMRCAALIAAWHQVPTVISWVNKGPCQNIPEVLC